VLNEASKSEVHSGTDLIEWTHLLRAMSRVQFLKYAYKCRKPHPMK